MGMPCQVNSILKLNLSQGYPAKLTLQATHRVIKSGYRIIPIDVPIPLVDEHWVAHADITIDQLIWENNQTQITFRISRIYQQPHPQKDTEIR